MTNGDALVTGASGAKGVMMLMNDYSNGNIGQGRSKTATDAFKSEYEMQAYRRKAQAVFNEIDFMLLPTVGTTYTIDEVNADPIKLNSNLGCYTNFMNLLDCAVVAVPAGMQKTVYPGV